MATIHPDTYNFFRELSKNNNRDWFNRNKSRYQEIREGFIEFLEAIYPDLKSIDPGIEGVDMRKSVFRINRDVRFSDDKSPYKVSIASVIIAGGRRNFSEYSGYYLHIENGDSLIAGGAYMPPSERITAIRAKIDRESDRFRSIIGSGEFTRFFGTLEGDKLKGAPRGYTADNPNIDLLRFKSFLAVRKLTEKEVLAGNFSSAYIETSKALKPLNDFLNEAT